MHALEYRFGTAGNPRGNDTRSSHPRPSHVGVSSPAWRQKSKSFAESGRFGDRRFRRIKMSPHADRTAPSTGAAPTRRCRRGRMAVGARRRRRARSPIGGRVVSPRPGCRSRNQDGIRGRCGYRVKRRM